MLHKKLYAPVDQLGGRLQNKLLKGLNENSKLTFQSMFGMR